MIVIRTIGRKNNALTRAHLSQLAPSLFASVRDPVIPIKMAAEAAFLSIFNVVDEGSIIFNRYIEAHASKISPQLQKTMQDYFKRVTIRQANQLRDRFARGPDASELSSDEKEDEKEIWSIGGTSFMN